VDLWVFCWIGLPEAGGAVHGSLNATLFYSQLCIRILFI
jgi:hypothetical protein